MIHSNSNMTRRAFLRPTLLGIGTCTMSVSLLAILLMLIGLSVRGGGLAAGTAGKEGAGHAAGEGFGEFAQEGAGGGNVESEEENLPGETNGPVVEIAETKTDNGEQAKSASAVPMPAPSSRPGTASFSIADLPQASAGTPRPSSGSGAGFSDIGERLSRAGAKSGDVQISLAWNNYNDLDLHVIAPSGEKLFYQHKNSACRGELDVDMNAGGRRSTRPVENIYWPVGRAPRGVFRVELVHYANHGGRDPTPYAIRVTVDGRTKTFKGKISFNGQRPVRIHRFTRN